MAGTPQLMSIADATRPFSHAGQALHAGYFFLVAWSFFSSQNSTASLIGWLKASLRSTVDLYYPDSIALTIDSSS